MKRVFLLFIFSMLIVAPVAGQEACSDYMDELVTRLEGISRRLRAYTNSESSIRSDYTW